MDEWLEGMGMFEGSIGNTFLKYDYLAGLGRSVAGFRTRESPTPLISVQLMLNPTIFLPQPQLRPLLALKQILSPTPFQDVYSSKFLQSTQNNARSNTVGPKTPLT